MNSRNFKLSTIALLLLSSLLGGCGGSETGNPVLESASPSAPVSGDASTWSGQIAAAICSKILSCHPGVVGLEQAQCDQGIRASTSIDTELGLAPGYGTYLSIIEAEKAVQLVPSAQNAAACITEVLANACDSSAVQAAYDPAVPADYNHLSELLSAGTTSCSQVF